MIGIIGGSGLYEIEGIIVKGIKKITTPFGAPSDSYVIGEFSGRDIVFLPRHGSSHNIPPHKINYRANIWGFRDLGVERLISVGATGGIGFGMVPGTIVVIDQIIDKTCRRNFTFFDGDSGVVHIDFTEPCCAELRKALYEAGKQLGVKIRKTGTYLCVNGPRLETKAEIRYFSNIGADVVGMTTMPEAALAREVEMCYSGISVVTNYAAGIKKKKLTATEVIDTMKRTTKQLKELLKKAFTMIPVQRKCLCREALKDARV